MGGVTRAVRGVLLVFICAVFISAAVAPLGTAAVGLSFERPVDGSASLGTDSAAQRDDTTVQQNNTTVQHVNPVSVNKEGNLSTVQRWLSLRLSGTLIDCAENIAVNESTCKKLDDQFPEWLDKYVEVSREIEDDSESKNTSVAFSRAHENQREYVSLLREFNRTKNAYQEARQNGNTERARRLARQLIGIATQLEGTGENLTGNYQTIETTTPANLTNATVTINTTTQRILETVENIETEQFVNTTIVANTSRTRISFLQPLRVTGYLVAENGTLLSGQTVQLRAGNVTWATTTTNATGGFVFTYRPVRLRLDTRRMTVRYAPNPTAIYNASATTIPIRIEQQVEPTINVSMRPDRAGFKDRVTISGWINADGIGVPSVPIAVSLDGERLRVSDRLRTGPTGRFEFVVRVPANVLPGSQHVRVSIPLSERAIANVSTTRPIQIVETPSSLTVSAPAQLVVNRSRAHPDAELNVTGQLVTVSGQPVSGQQVTIRVNGTTVGVAQTGPNGTYATTVNLPPKLFSGQRTTTVRLVAVYSGTQTNLATDRAADQVQIIVYSDAGFFDIFGTLLSNKLALGIGIIVFGLVLGYRFRKRYWIPSPEEHEQREEGLAEGTVEQLTTKGMSDSQLLETERNQLAADDFNRAIVTAYTTTRARLSAEFRSPSAQTHWEFFRECQGYSLDDRQLDVFRQLTETYERAVFSPHSPSEETVMEAIENAHDLDDNILRATDES